MRRRSVIEIDRDKAAQLGLSMSQVGEALWAACSAAPTPTTSAWASRSYKVISQVQQRSRLTIDQVMHYQIATINGTPIPMSAIARVRQETVPRDDHAFPAAELRDHFRRADARRVAGRRRCTRCSDLAAQDLPR